MWKIVFPPFVALQQTATRVAITFLFLNIDALSRKHKKNEEWLSVWFFFLTESKSIFSRVHECQFFWFIRKLSNHFSSSFQPLCFETDSLFEPRLRAIEFFCGKIWIWKQIQVILLYFLIQTKKLYQVLAMWERG